MAFPYVGEIRMFGGNFEPNGWRFCRGQALLISEYDTLFNLIGTTYGGDGEETFNLPDLRGRVPVHMGSGPGLSTWQLGETGGVEEITLTVNQVPVHTHQLQVQDGAATHSKPSGRVPAEPAKRIYRAPGAMTPMVATGTAGLSQPHNNLAPYLCINFIISLFGIFPAQS